MRHCAKFSSIGALIIANARRALYPLVRGLGLPGLVLGFLAANVQAIATPVEAVDFADPALAECVRTYAREQHYATVEEVKEIPCFHRGIQSIKGLEAFTAALVVDLSRNQISDFQPLFALDRMLGYVDIHENPITCEQLIALSHQLRHAYRVGFDPSSCLGAPAPTGPSPTPPSPSTPPSPAPSAPRPTEPVEPGSISYQEVAPVIAEACGHCHQGGRHKGGIALDDEAALRRNAGAIADSIHSGRMPPRDPQWRDSADGKTVITYLQSLGGQGAGGADHGRGDHHGHDGHDGSSGGHDDDDDHDHDDHHGSHGDHDD